MHSEQKKSLTRVLQESFRLVDKYYISMVGSDVSEDNKKTNFHAVQSWKLRWVLKPVRGGRKVVGTMDEQIEMEWKDSKNEKSWGTTER